MFYWRLNRSFNTRNYYHVSVKAIDWLSEWVKCAAFRKLYSLFLKRRHFQINLKHFLLFFLYFLCSLWKETRDKHPPRWRYQAYDTRKSIWTSLPSGKYVLYEYLFLEILVLRLAYVNGAFYSFCFQLQAIMSKVLDHMHDFSVLVSMVSDFFVVVLPKSLNLYERVLW